MSTKSFAQEQVSPVNENLINYIFNLLVEVKKENGAEHTIKERTLGVCSVSTNIKYFSTGPALFISLTDTVAKYKISTVNAKSKSSIKPGGYERIDIESGDGISSTLHLIHDGLGRVTGLWLTCKSIDADGYQITKAVHCI